jgi:polyhydroxyalkanoate synthase subunit PhaC
MNNYLNQIYGFLQGINLFYAQFERRYTTAKIIWEDGSTKLLEYSKAAKTELPILIFIPSLINKSYILDLSPDCSIIKYFTNLGYRVYLIDFTEPSKEESSMGFNDFCFRVEQAINYVVAQQNSPIITIGYCLGGLISCAIAKKDSIVGQVLLATPWNFTHLIEKFTNKNIKDELTLFVKEIDKISPTLIQHFFSIMDLEAIWNKFYRFSLLKNAEEIEQFFKIEQWVNDGISLTKQFAIEALDAIFEDKKFINSFNKNKPCLAFAGLLDKISPLDSCVELYQKFSNVKIILEDTGHIGLLVGKSSREKIYCQIEQWLHNFK